MGQTPLITDLLHHSVCTQSILLQADTDNLQIFLLLPVQQMIEKTWTGSIYGMLVGLLVNCSVSCSTGGYGMSIVFNLSLGMGN